MYALETAYALMFAPFHYMIGLTLLGTQFLNGNNREPKTFFVRYSRA